MLMQNMAVTVSVSLQNLRQEIQIQKLFLFSYEQKDCKSTPHGELWLPMVYLVL